MLLPTTNPYPAFLDRRTLRLPEAGSLALNHRAGRQQSRHINLGLLVYKIQRISLVSMLDEMNKKATVYSIML